jgi:Tfp pilus assembly protein PilX
MHPQLNWRRHKQRSLRDAAAAIRYAECAAQQLMQPSSMLWAETPESVLGVLLR